MKNPFSNIDIKKTKIPLQEKQGNEIIKKKAGRPKRPNMQSYIIKLDKDLHKRISNYATKVEMNKSAVISIAIREFLEKKFYDINNQEAYFNHSKNEIEGLYIIKKIINNKLV